MRSRARRAHGIQHPRAAEQSGRAAVPGGRRLHARDRRARWRRRWPAAASQRAFVIHGAEGWDEPTRSGAFTLFDVGCAGVRREQRTPADYGLARCSAERTARAAMPPTMRASCARVLERPRARSAHRDALLLGAALALEVTGREAAPRAALARAAAGASTSGAARDAAARAWSASVPRNARAARPAA